MKKIKLIGLVVLTIFLSSFVNSQNVNRIQLNADFSNISLYPVIDQGLLILEKISINKKTADLKLNFLNNMMESKWSKSINHNGYSMDRIRLSEDNKKAFISFFSDDKKNQWSHRVLYNENVRILSVNLEDGSTEIMDAELPSNSTLKEFGATNEMLYAIFFDKGNLTSKNKSFAIVRSIQSKQNYTIELGEDVKLVDVIGCYTNNSDDNVYVMISYKDKAKDFIGCEIDKLQSDGKKQKMSKTALSEESEWPFDCMAFHNENSLQLFGYDMLNDAMTMDLIEPASAFSMLKIENNKVSSFSTTGFGDLKHPMLSVSDNALTGLIEGKIKANRAKKGKLDQAFNIVSHPSIKSGDFYYSFFESYAPIYEITTSTSPSGMGTSQSKKYKESFFPHLQFACFDGEGNLIWDNNCKLKKFTREKGNANTTWQVEDDGTVSSVTHTDNYQVFLFKTKKDNTIIEEKSTFRDILNESEWKDMVSSTAIHLSGSQYSFSVVAIPFSTEKSNWTVCYIGQKDKKSPYYLYFKPFKF